MCERLMEKITGSKRRSSGYQMRQIRVPVLRPTGISAPGLHGLPVTSEPYPAPSSPQFTPRFAVVPTPEFVSSPEAWMCPVLGVLGPTAITQFRKDSETSVFDLRWPNGQEVEIRIRSSGSD